MMVIMKICFHVGQLNQCQQMLLFVEYVTVLEQASAAAAASVAFDVVVGDVAMPRAGAPRSGASSSSSSATADSRLAPRIHNSYIDHATGLHILLAASSSQNDHKT
jgi:murein endopeptidase